MEPKVDHQRHQPFQDLLGAAAFGTLTAGEQRLLKPHLAGCAECQAELADFQVIASALAMTLDEREPSRELRGRIQASILQAAPRQADAWGAVTAPRPPVFAPPDQAARPAPRTVARPASGGTVTPFRGRYVWATAALVLLAILAGALAGRMIFADDSTKDTPEDTIALQVDPSIPNASGTLAYLPDEQVFKLTMHDMPAAPANHVYQVWLIDANGPVPVGMVDQANGLFAVAADRSRFDTFAITVEPGPLGSKAPTTTPIIVAPLEEST